MKKQDIINAYLEIRKTNNTIPDDVLDFMKNSAIEKLEENMTEDEKALECGLILIRCIGEDLKLLVPETLIKHLSDKNLIVFKNKWYYDLDNEDEIIKIKNASK